MSGPPPPSSRRDSAALQPLGMPAPVAVHVDAAGRPRALRDVTCHEAKRSGRAQRGPTGRREVAPDRRIVQIREVWRIDDEWWRRPISRLYHQVVLDDGRMVVLYRDLIDDKWYLQ